MTTLSKGPVLILLKDGELDHFTILKGVRGDRAYLADPARGNIRMPMARFLAEWDGTALILGKKDFGLPMDHGLALPITKEERPEIRAARQMMFR